MEKMGQGSSHPEKICLRSFCLLFGVEVDDETMPPRGLSL